jgi:hypothetical protein
MSLYFKVTLCVRAIPIQSCVKHEGEAGVATSTPRPGRAGKPKLRAGPRAENSRSACAAAATLLPHSPTHKEGEQAGRQVSVF